jgi:putative transcriptional regulator
MIEVKIDKLLKKQGRSFYWLAKETGISHTTLWRLKKRKALGINFDTLEKICQALACQPGDVLGRANQTLARRVPKRKSAYK